MQIDLVKWTDDNGRRWIFWPVWSRKDFVSDEEYQEYLQKTRQAARRQRAAQNTTLDQIMGG